MPNASKKGGGMGHGTTEGHQHVGPADPADESVLHRDEMANQTMGYNRLHGNDQTQVHNERHQQAQGNADVDADPVESARKVNPDEKLKGGDGRKLR